MDSFKYKDILRNILKVKCGEVCLQSGKLFFLFLFSSPFKDKAQKISLIQVIVSFVLLCFVWNGLNGMITIHNEIISHLQVPTYKIHVHIDRQIDNLCLVLMPLCAHGFSQTYSFFIHASPLEDMKYNEKLSLGFGISRDSVYNG